MTRASVSPLARAVRTKSDDSTSSIAPRVIRARNAIDRVPQGQRRQDQECDAAVPRRRQPLRVTRTRDSSRPPNTPETTRRHTRAAAETVDGTVGPDRGDHAQGDTNGRGEEHRGASQLQRLGESLGEVSQTGRWVMYEWPKSPRTTPHR